MKRIKYKTEQQSIRHLFPSIKEWKREKISTDFLPFCLYNSKVTQKFPKNSF